MTVFTTYLKLKCTHQRHWDAHGNALQMFILQMKNIDDITDHILLVSNNNNMTTYYYYVFRTSYTNIPITRRYETVLRNISNKHLAKIMTLSLKPRGNHLLCLLTWPCLLVKHKSFRKYYTQHNTTTLY